MSPKFVNLAILSCKPNGLIHKILSSDVILLAVLMGSQELTKGSLAWLDYPAQIMFKSTKTKMLFCSTVVGLPFLLPPMILTGELFKAWNSCYEHPYVYSVLVFEARTTYVGQVSVLSLIAPFQVATTAMVVIGMDVAASKFYGSDKTYDLNFKEEKNDGSQKISGNALKDLYKSFVSEYPIVSIKDPFDQDD
ncbi:hypothetical protein ACE6H2_016067 [Prunus campanulata]